MLWLGEAQAAVKRSHPFFILGLAVAGCAFVWWALWAGGASSEAVRIFVG